MKRQLLQKLCSSAGETIAEVLVALLVSSFALMLLAGMISATARVITRSTDIMNKYYTEEIESLIEFTGEGTSATAEISMEISMEDAATPQSVSVSCYENKSLGGKSVISYKKAGES